MLRRLAAPGLLVLAALVTAGLAAPARADLVFTVTLDTRGLVGSPLGPFSLDVQLTDGSGAGDGNNSVTLDSFSFGGGGPVGLPVLAGGASGDLAGTVSLADSAFFNGLTQGFTPGDALSFRARVTTNPDAGAAPDLFAFAILDGTGAELATEGPDALAGVLVGVEISSPSPPVWSFATTAAAGVSLPAARVEVMAEGVPEPSSWLLVLLLAGVGMTRFPSRYAARRRRGLRV